MTQRFVIALTLEARRAGAKIDLAEYIQGRFGEQCRVIERGYGGKSVTVEMPKSLLSTLRNEMSFATIEPARQIQLLQGAQAKA